VDESGLMGVTQQMSQFGSGFMHQAPQHPVQNPFASPVKDQTQSSPHQPSSQSLNPTAFSNSFEQNQILLGSPMGSDIAQQGSFPSSPCVQGMEEPAPTRITEGIRAALFQVSDIIKAVGRRNKLLEHRFIKVRTFHWGCSEYCSCTPSKVETF
jgi:hypothetical protein